MTNEQNLYEFSVAGRDPVTVEWIDWPIGEPYNDERIVVGARVYLTSTFGTRVVRAISRIGGDWKASCHGLASRRVHFLETSTAIEIENLTKSHVGRFRKSEGIVSGPPLYRVTALFPAKRLTWPVRSSVDHLRRLAGWPFLTEAELVAALGPAEVPE